MHRRNGHQIGTDEDDDLVDDSYVTRADGYTEEYRKAYADWWGTLTPDERASMRGKGLAQPLVDYHASESTMDVSDRNFPIERRDEQDDASDVQRHIWEVVERIAILIIDASNVRLEADTLAYMAGFHARMGRSGTELGARYGMCRATWSKRCKKLQRELGLPPSRGMKSEEACRVYALTNGAMRSRR